MTSQIETTEIARPIPTRAIAPSDRAPDQRRGASGQLGRAPDPGRMEHVADDDTERLEAVHDTALEVDRAGLLEVASGHADLADLEAPGSHDLGD